MINEEITIPQSFTHSIKIEDTAKGIRLSVNFYTNDRNTAINEAIAKYLETKQKCEREKIQIAPMEVLSK